MYAPEQPQAVHRMRLPRALEIGLVLLAAIAASGCEQGRKAPEKTRVQVVNAAPNHPPLNFLRVQRAEATEIGYGAATGALPFDVDQYDFHVEMLSPNTAAPTRISSMTRAIAADVDYTFVLAENATGGIEPIVVETPVAEAGAGATLAAVHAGLGLPSVDVYVEAPGADLSTATPIGRLGYRDIATGASRAAGDYAVTVTEAGNPSAVLLASGTVTLASAQRAVLVVLAGAGEGTAPLRVVVAQDSPMTLLDPSVTAALRVVNAAADQAPRDVAIDSNFSPPLLAGVPFGTVSAYAPLAAGERATSVTPAGNPGVVETTETLTVAGGRLYTLIVSGAPGSVDAAPLVDDHRRIFDRAQLALYNGASQFDSLHFYVLQPGTDPNTVAPVATLAAPGGTQYVGLAAGEYDLVLRNADLATVAGPLRISVENGGIYSAVGVNGPDASSASLLLLDDFAVAP